MGVSVASLSNNQTINDTDILGNQWTHEYIANSQQKVAMLLGLNGGYEFSLPRNFFLGLGLGAYKPIGGFSASGENWNTLGGNRQHQYNYEYQVDSTYLLGEAKLRWQINRFSPFVMAGVGPSWNRADDFSTQPLGQATTPSYPSHTQTELAYQLGIGLEYQINKLNYAGVAYKYSDLGKAEFDQVNTNEFPHKLEVGSIRTNDFLFTITHHFGN